MKRIVLLVVCLAAAVGAARAAYPDDFMEMAGEVGKFGQWVWDGTRTNPVPVSLALGTFLLTVAYHKARGKSLRESVEVAATRVALVPVPVRDGADAENPVVRRARARATRTQLLADQIGLENRQRKLPEEVLKAEKESCYTQQAVADAQRKLADKRRAHKEAMAKLEALRDEKARGEAELAAIEAELAKLAELV